MPDDADNRTETGWLLEPPGPGEVQVNIEIGSNVELSPEARATLETLMHGLEEEEGRGLRVLARRRLWELPDLQSLQELPAPHQVPDLLLVHTLSHRRHRLMRESRYNVWVERNGSSYVYNGVSGGFLRLSHDERAAVGRVVDDPTSARLSAERARADGDRADARPRRRRRGRPPRQTVRVQPLRHVALRAHHRDESRLQLRLPVLLRGQAPVDHGRRRGRRGARASSTSNSRGSRPST